jgi:HipA-like protein
MLKKIKSWFSKDPDEASVPLPKEKDVKFLLRVDDIKVGYLYSNKGDWYFEYSNDFKNHLDYNLITGFPELNKVYKSDELWPFFRIRIPGLKQPVVMEILEKEKIDKNDEVELLKRFGQKTISNPYELVVA